TKRFVCMTGNIVGDITELKDLSNKIGELNKRYLGKPIEYKPVVRTPATKSDRELIDLISNSKQGAKFDRLYRGDWQGSYETQSSADFALARILSYWTKDESQIDSIFRSSGLYRPKWDNSGGYYGKRTINMALSMAHNTAEM
ncbi:MAG: DNA primase, partial [Clostridia bacterium]|nr:DNA primase [Clostridia bacterium]